MAVRPVFVVSLDRRHCTRENVEFEYFGGFSVAQKRRCINSLHQSYLSANPGKKVLEISSKSEEELGVRLSAFNLMIKAGDGRQFSVESAFQAGKVFENGGPYLDLLDVSSKAAKKDERLNNSGRIIAFEFDRERFETEPKTYFYNWLYISALHSHEELAKPLLEYVFYPEVSDERTTAALLIDLDPLDLARGKVGSTDGGLFDYVNDRPYASTSFMSTALVRVFGTAMSGKCAKRQELADSPLKLTACIHSLKDNGDLAFAEEMFEPLG